MKPRKQENNSHKSGQSVGGKGRLLVIARKDKDDVGGFIAENLETKGFEVQIVEAEGRQDYILDDVYSELSRRSYEVVLPTNNGLGYPYILKLVPGIKERFRKVRIIVVSGYHEADFVNRLTEYGIDGFIRMPFKVDDLVRHVQGIEQGT